MQLAKILGHKLWLSSFNTGGLSLDRLNSRPIFNSQLYAAIKSNLAFFVWGTIFIFTRFEEMAGSFTEVVLLKWINTRTIIQQFHAF